MPRFTYKVLLCRKRRTSQDASHHSKKQKKCRSDDAFSNRASSTNKPYKRTQNISSKERTGFTPTAMGPHFSLRPQTGADNVMHTNSCNKSEERSHIEANKKYGGMSRLEYLVKRKFCTYCGPGRKQSNPVQMGCYSPGTEPDHIPYHLYMLVKEVVDIMTRFKRSQIASDLRDLPRVEEKIKFFCIHFHCHLPRGWEYKRKNASSLIAGYDTFFAKDGPRYNLSGYTPFRDKLKSCFFAEVMSIVHSRKTPTPETFMEWCKDEILFYCKICSCFGIDYQHLETASEDDVCLMNMGS